MNTKDIINKAMRDRNTSQRKMCKYVGVIQQQLSRSINNPQSMKVEMFCNLMNAMGYEVIVRDKYSGEEIICDTAMQE